jgi:hypothetical protein
LIALWLATTCAFTQSVGKSADQFGMVQFPNSCDLAAQAAG